MPEEPKKPKVPVPDQTPSASTAPRSPDEARVWELLESARQSVKGLVKREKEAEVMSSDLLNFRLK